MKKHYQKLFTLLKLAANNESLKFLVWRLQQNDYRGLHLSQHNRLTYQKFKALITSIVIVQNEVGGYISIPRGDAAKDFYIGDFPQYEKLIICFHQQLEKIGMKPQGTANSIKKNLFPDLARMKVIIRYANIKNEIIKLSPFAKTAINFISINPNLKITEKITDDFFLRKIFEEQSKILYWQLIPLLNAILEDEKIKGVIDENEFLFFITWYHKKYQNDIFIVENIIAMIDSWRKLERSVRKAIINFIKNWAIPQKFTGNKTNARDFANWKNETQDIMKHFKNSNLFSLNQNASKLQLVYSQKNLIKLKESVILILRKSILKSIMLLSKKVLNLIILFPFHEVLRLQKQ